MCLLCVYYVFICVYMCLYVFICVYKTTFFPLSSGVPPSKTCGFSTAALACLAKSPRCGIAQLRPWPVIVHRPSFSRGAKEPGCMGLSQQNFINWLVVTGTFFIYPYIGNNHPNWLSYFFKMVKATNQINYVFFLPLKVGFDLRNTLDSTSLRMWLSTNIGISLGCCSHQRRMFCDENQGSNHSQFSNGTILAMHSVR